MGHTKASAEEEERRRPKSHTAITIVRSML